MICALRGVIIRSHPGKANAAKIDKNNIASLSEAFIAATCLLMRRGPLQLFFALIGFFIASSTDADLVVGQKCAFNFTDVDGNKFSAADDRVTTIVVTPPGNVDKVRMVGDRIPDYCLANPAYRMITILNFEKQHTLPMRKILAALVRRRLNGEGKRLQQRYAARKITRDPRKDVCAVADFDGSAVSQLGIPHGSTTLQVFVFGRNGELLQRWNDVPSAPDLAAVIK
jgi:hypothetical protein